MGAASWACRAAGYLFQASVMLVFSPLRCLSASFVCLGSFSVSFFAACGLPVSALLLFLRNDGEVTHLARELVGPLNHKAWGLVEGIAYVVLVLFAVWADLALVASVLVASPRAL